MGQHTRFPRVLMRAMPLAALIAGIWLPSLALGQNNEGLKLVPFTINVNSNSPVELYVYIQGEVAQQTATLPPNTAVYISDLQGDVTIIPTCPNPPVGCSLALDVGSQPMTQMMLPRLKGMRLYFSVNTPFLINSNQIGVLPDILGGGWTPTGENYNTIFDFAELDWQNRRFGGNVSEVDMFGIPMVLQMTGTNPGNNQPVTLNAGFTERRSTIIAA